MGRSECLPLFETKQAKGQTACRLYLSSIFVGICWIWVCRVIYVPEKGDSARLAWLLLFGAELWFSLYWVLTVSVLQNRVHRYAFKDRLSLRYEEMLPGVDVFVCTADPIIEPPMMVINTVLSLMAYNYPPEKLSVYLSDDGGSELTFYALLEASHFAKHWIPFCKKFCIEPRSPAAYFSTLYDPLDLVPKSKELQSIKILIDGRDPDAVDTEGSPLPSLVYLSREKRPKHPHNFKAGAMNSLIRVSSNISNGSIILNVDCDMYLNNSESVRDALCFLMDEEQGHEIAFVQFPQCFVNITRNDIYGSAFKLFNEVEALGMDGYGGPSYNGTGCFHRRKTLCGMKYMKRYKFEWQRGFERKEGSVSELEERSKNLASCTFEQGTEWGDEMGLRYGCALEDVITGLLIQCRGWKSVYFNPARKGFLGVAPVTLAETLVQNKRWSEGSFQVFLSKYGLFANGLGRIKLGLQMAYCCYCLWPPSCFATLHFLIVPPLCLLKGIPLVPKVSSVWFLPFAYVIITVCSYSLVEFLLSGGTLLGWWNEQRMWMFRRATSCLFGFMDTLLKLIGFSKSAFDITAKVVDQDVSQRYEQEIMEFGTSSPMFIILATLVMLNLFRLIGGLKRVITTDLGIWAFESLFMQVLLCSIVVFINLPVYQGLFFRNDKGRMPTSVTIKSTVLALVLVCMISLY